MIHSVRLTPSKVIVDGRELDCEGEGMELLTNLYKRFIDDYPKYYKMDALCRLGFVASELLLKMEDGRCKMDDGRREMRESRAIVLFNRSSSIQADLSYQASIQDPENYFPSPSAFVYTLPNIVTGEIAIRNHYQGETSFYILPEKDEQLMEQVIAASFEDRGTQSMICGWLDYQDDANFEAKLELRVNGL
jgi:3-oxoacyl-[acyl-carrier-protein] synthase-1